MSEVIRKVNKDIFKQLAKLGDGSVAVGYFPEAREDDGQPTAQVAYNNEFGEYKRPFMRTTLHEQEGNWTRLCVSLVRSGMPITEVMDKVGNRIRGDIEAKIIKIASAGGNADSTIAKKGFDSPLVDTGAMLRQVSYKVGYAK